MKAYVLALGLVAAAAIPSPASAVTGILMDAPCAASYSGSSIDDAREHSKTCSLVKVGGKKGFALVTESGDVLKLDPKGAKLALMTVKHSKKDAEVLMEVDGTVKKDRLSVDSLKTL